MTLNPNRVQVEPGSCSDVPQPWGPLEESFGGGEGMLTGMVLGYRMRSLRVEGEYVYRIAAHDDTAVPHDSADELRSHPGCVVRRGPWMPLTT